MRTVNLNIIRTVIALAAGWPPIAVNGGFSLPSGSASPGHGITNVLSGTVANGGLYWQSTTNWLNAANPITTFTAYNITNNYLLPVCDSILVARIVMTVWGGNANYVSHTRVTINGATLPAADPLVFGSTSDANPVFSANSANAYGSGSGVWLVTLPVPPEMLLKDGASNQIVVSQTSPNGFDGRVQHVTLLTVYQSSSLANTVDYSIAEGGGDIYKTPSGSQLSQRAIAFDPVNPEGAIAATLRILYTYGDGLNDRLYFNGTQLGGDNIADWNTAVANNGPSVVSFDVLQNLSVNNTAVFSLAADVSTPETSLRPQFAVLAVTRSAAVTAPSLSISNSGQIAWATNSPGFQLQSNNNLIDGVWAPVTNVPTVINDRYTINVDLSESLQFFRLKKSN